jgi:hypothetical protein
MAYFSSTRSSGHGDGVEQIGLVSPSNHGHAALLSKSQAATHALSLAPCVHPRKLVRDCRRSVLSTTALLLGSGGAHEIEIASFANARKETDCFLHQFNGFMGAACKAFAEDGADGHLLRHVGPLIDSRIPEQSGQNLDRAIHVSWAPANPRR